MYRVLPKASGATWLAVTALAALLAAAPACAPRKVVSPQATALPPVAQDPRETGENLGRWPGFRGPDCSGIAPGGNPPVRFGPAKNLRWKAAVPGRGNSSPVVWDDYVLLTSALEQFDPPPLVVLCYDRTSGRQLWQAPAGQARGRTHPKNGYASASVATDGQRIFAFFGAAGLFCFDFNGQLQWQADLGDLDHQWGLAASPVLFDRLVIQLCDSQRESYLAAFDKTTGQQVWRTERPSSGCWSTPVLVSAERDEKTQRSSPPGNQPRPALVEARRELVVNGAQTRGKDGQLLIAYDPRDGRELWRAGGTTELVTPVPLCAAGMVFSISGRNGPIMALRPGGSGNVTDSHLVWKLSRSGPYIPSGLVYRNRLYVIDDGGRLTCYNAGNGELLWSQRLHGPYTASLVAAAGRIYALSEHGTVDVVAAGDRFELLAENELGARCLATPAIAEDELFIRSEDTLYCFAEQAETTAPESTQPVSTAPESTRPVSTTPASGTPEAGAPEPRPNENAGLAGPQDETCARDQAEATAAAGDGPVPTARSWPLARGDRQATGVAQSSLPPKLELLWTFTTKRGGFEATAVIADGTVFVGSLDGNFYALDLASGQKQWEFSTEVGFTAAAAVYRGRVYVGDADGIFYCLDAQSGRKLWRFQSDAEINSGANFHADRVLFGSQDTFLYCLEAESGRLVWKYENADQIRCFPAIAGEFTFVAGCDGRLHIIRLADGQEVGHVDLQAPTGSAPACLGEMVFVGTEGNMFFGIDWPKRKVRWHYENAERPWPFRSSAAVTDRLVIVGSQDKLVHAFQPLSGQEVWSFATKGRVDSSPVVVGDRVFVGSLDGRLYALELASGRELWHFEAGGGILASPAVAGGRLVIGTDNGQLYCFGAKDPE